MRSRVGTPILTVRESVPGDEREVAEVDRLATADLRTVYRPTAEAQRARSVMDTHLQRLVAVLDGRVVGTVQYHVVGERLSFLALGVHPAFRRRGVARALVQQLERIGSDSGCSAVTLYTVRETGNVSIFERMGFRVESEEPTRLFESRSHRTLSEVMMRKTLAEGAAR